MIFFAKKKKKKNRQIIIQKQVFLVFLKKYQNIYHEIKKKPGTLHTFYGFLTNQKKIVKLIMNMEIQQKTLFWKSF